jgi:hypothetical protein
MKGGAKNATFCAVYIQNASFYQDRLGTDIGKVEKRVAFFAGGGDDQGLAAAAVAGGETLGTAGLNASSLTLLYEWE